MNFAILPNFGNPSCYFVSDKLTQIICTLPQDVQPQFYVVNGNICLIASCNIFVNRRNKPRTIAMSSTRE